MSYNDLVNLRGGIFMQEPTVDPDNVPDNEPDEVVTPDEAIE